MEIMMNDEAGIIKERFDSLENRYQENMESLKSTGFVFNYAHLLYIK